MYTSFRTSVVDLIVALILSCHRPSSQKSLYDVGRVISPERQTEWQTCTILAARLPKCEVVIRRMINKPTPDTALWCVIIVCPTWPSRSTWHVFQIESWRLIQSTIPSRFDLSHLEPATCNPRDLNCSYIPIFGWYFEIKAKKPQKELEINLQRP